ncbi:hypothetical protein KQI76_00535 [Amphibacillus sp. MSJ-3]|uniref:hypothetical protein n=1 Tax=Amphibacillus sp. MSJ-3 TaxID=2841505 RepID=UPI001C0F2A78|nr:hypothetical protein [Amphibacillus sp. MSJ-3]MBU5593644.1 hypothetical protein [Amphibacillus sp. MSJ-3]
MCKKVICEKCNGRIETIEDLVTDVIVLSVKPYHEKCYMRDLKGGPGFFLSGRPLNGWAGNIGFIVAILIAMISLVSYKKLAFLFFFSLIPIAYRLYSYFVYEYPLKKFDR